MLISSHDSKTLYMGGNFVFKSTNRGDAWTAISPELTTEKVGTITTIARIAGRCFGALRRHGRRKRVDDARREKLEEHHRESAGDAGQAMGEPAGRVAL